MSIKFEEENGGKVLAVYVNGKLVKEDYEEFVSEFRRLVTQHGNVRLLMDMTEFQGWEDCASWEDTKFAVHRFANIKRMAMVGENKWHSGMAAFCRPFTQAMSRYFVHVEAAKVRAWLNAE